MRGQGSTELIIILIVGAIALLALFSTYTGFATAYAGGHEARKARMAVDDLADTAIAVRSQAVGARQELFITMPAWVQNVTIGNKMVLLTLLSPSGNHTIYRSLGFNITGNLSNTEAGYWVFVESKKGYVDIYPKP